jgi:hypothetical protein
VLRYLIAERLEADLNSEQFNHCRSAISNLSDREITSIVRQAAEHASRAARDNGVEKTKGDKSAGERRCFE